MKRLNVRCCCEGSRILGTLPVPDAVAVNGGWFDVWDREAVASWQAAATAERELGGPHHISKHRINVRWFGEPWGEYEETAVYSDDRPVEFWRKIPGFVEGEGVPLPGEVVK